MPENRNDTEALQSRRTVLKMLAASPLLVTFGMVASPLMRYLKPTMAPFDFFQPADLPKATLPPQFERSDFPDIWTCMQFMFPMKCLVFNPEQYEVRNIPAYIIRVEENKIVAFSRMCPLQGTALGGAGSCTQRDTLEHYLSYVRPKDHGSCGCCDGGCSGDCIGRSATPVLVCPRDGSVFDICNNGSVLIGPARSPARQFVVEQEGDVLSVSRFEDARIVV